MQFNAAPIIRINGIASDALLAGAKTLCGERDFRRRPTADLHIVMSIASPLVFCSDIR
jgi:hypothetical protein